MNPLIEKRIADVVKKIKGTAAIEKIILFGSAAWGEPSEWSDIDLFIIMRSQLRRDKRSILISSILSDRTFPVDIIVYTPEEVDRGLKRENPFLQKIMKEGKVLYAA